MGNIVRITSYAQHNMFTLKQEQNDNNDSAGGLMIVQKANSD